MDTIRGKKNIFIGFDGFIDTIVRAVDRYDGGKKIYMRLIEQFGERILSAAGKSINIELDVVYKKIGGNGPLLSDALYTLGANTTYIGTLGDVKNNVFQEFARKNHGSVFSIGDPGETRAVEFEDGKILLGEMYDTVNIDAERICSIIGREGLRDIVSKNKLLCFVNWTMLLKLNSIFELFLNDIMDVNDKHISFFDIADPTKRSKEDVQKLISYLQKFSKISDTILGLNLNEASNILTALEVSTDIFEQKDSMIECARIIREKIGCGAVFIHANTMSAGNNNKQSAFVEGYFSPSPKISTGAGDHFNAGFLFDYLDDRDLESALHMGSAVAKYYVEHARSPTSVQARQETRR